MSRVPSRIRRRFHEAAGRSPGLEPTLGRGVVVAAMKLPPDFWSVSEDDEHVGFLQLFAAFVAFTALLAVILIGAVLVWAAMQ